MTDWTIDTFVENYFLMDGCISYGVPRKIWERFDPPDADNNVRLNFNLYVLRGPDGPVLIDAGPGDGIPADHRKIYPGLSTSRRDAGLAALGLTRADIRHVVMTHLHLDHCGGLFAHEAGEEWAGLRPAPTTPEIRLGRLAPAYPNARVWINAIEWATAHAPDPRSAPAYWADGLDWLAREGLVEQTSGARELFDGLWIEPTGGHTHGHQRVRVRLAEGTGLFMADILPTRHHWKLPYVAAIDVDPLRVMEVKSALHRECADGAHVIYLDHDTSTARWVPPPKA